MNRNFLLVFIGLAFTIVFVGCTEQLYIDPDISVETTSIKSYGDSIYVKAEFEEINLLEINQYGFTIRTDLLEEIENGDVFEVGTVPQYKNFSHTTFNRYLDNSEFYVRAYCRTIDGLYFFGKPLTFYGQETTVLAINSFQPLTGKIGDVVKIYGKNFSNEISNMKVYFGDKEAEIINASLERLVVKVPSYSESKKVSLSIKKFQQPSVEANDEFQLFGPIINSFLPTQISAESEFVISGEGFSEYPWRNIVNIGDYSAKVISSSPTELIVKFMSSDINSGQYPVSVEVDEIVSFGESFITVQ